MLIPKAISVSEAAARSGLAQCSIYQLIHENKIDHFRIGRKHYSTEESLARYMKGDNGMAAMKTITFKDGEISVPSDFIELDLVDPSVAEIPMVMTVKNEDLYNTPNFIFFGNTYPCNLTNAEAESLYKQAERYYPGYSKLNDQIINVKFPKNENGNTVMEFYDIHGNRKTEEDWKNAPCIGIFPAEMRAGIDDRPLPYGIEISFRPGRDPRIYHELLNR